MALSPHHFSQRERMATNNARGLKTSESAQDSRRQHATSLCRRAGPSNQQRRTTPCPFLPPLPTFRPLLSCRCLSRLPTRAMLRLLLSAAAILASSQSPTLLSFPRPTPLPLPLAPSPSRPISSTLHVSGASTIVRCTRAQVHTLLKLHHGSPKRLREYLDWLQRRQSSRSSGGDELITLELGGGTYKQRLAYLLQAVGRGKRPKGSDRR